LNARGDIGCVTEYVGFPATTLFYDHCAGVDADADREFYCARFACESIVQWFHRIDDCQSCPNRAFRIVLMSLRITEVHHQSIAEIFGYMAAESCHCLGSGALIVRGYVVPIFGIEMSGDSSRVDEIAEQHRKMAALAIGSVRGRCCRRRRALDRERCSTISAESFVSGIIRSASRTKIRECRSAISAELLAGWIFSVAIRAADRPVCGGLLILPETTSETRPCESLTYR
jgi:hypothetical protein